MRIVAYLVANPVHKDIPAVDRRRTVTPWINTERTIIAVEVASVSIALLVTMMIAGFLAATVLHALLALVFQVEIVGVCDLGHVNVGPAEHAATISRVVDLAVLAGPLGWAVARVIANQVFADRVRLLAGIARALVSRVYLAVRATGARWTVAPIAARVIVLDYTRTAVHARLGLAIGAGELAVRTVVIDSANARVSIITGAAHATVQARRALAEVHLVLTVTSHVTGLAVAVKVVDQLHAILSAHQQAWIREALVDVTFAARPDETGRAVAHEAANLVDARAVVVAGANHAVVHVDLAYEAESAGRAGAAKGVDQIVTRATVLARIRLAVVNVQFAILTLEALGAMALVRAHEILAGSAVLARCGVALVNLLLTIGAGVTVETVTTMAIANVFAGTVVAEVLLLDTLADGGILARDHLHVAYLAGPTGRTDAVILVLVLHTRCLILAWIVRAPVDVLVAPCTRVSVRAVTSVVLHVVVAGGTVQAGRAVALIDAVLAVGARVTGFADARVVVDAVDALAAVHAATVGAVFVVGLAIDAGEAKLTLTRIGVYVLLADGTVLAGLRQTFVDVHLAVFPAEAVHA